MGSSDALYSELEPDIVALASPLFELSERFLKARNNFLPHGAVLTDGGQVKLVAGAPENDWTNSTEVLPVLHDALRQSAKEGVKALALAENVTITPEGGKATAAIKVLFEHQRGLVVALYLPFKKRLLRGYEFGESFSVLAAPEVNAWGGCP
jgi:hypothetical protein